MTKIKDNSRFLCLSYSDYEELSNHIDSVIDEMWKKVENIKVKEKEKASKGKQTINITSVINLDNNFYLTQRYLRDDFHAQRSVFNNKSFNKTFIEERHRSVTPKRKNK